VARESPLPRIAAASYHSVVKASLAILILAILCMAAAPATNSTTAPTTKIDPATRELVEHLAASNPERRARAERDLLSLGRAARPALLEAMESEDPQIRISASTLILKLPFDYPGDAPSVTRYLEKYGKPDAAARIRDLPSIWSAARDAGPRIMLRLVREDPSDDVRWAIVRMLRSVDRRRLGPVEQLDSSAAARAPNLALAGWLWETRDFPAAINLYRQCARLELARPYSAENPEAAQASDFVFESLIRIDLWDHNYDDAADILRAQYARHSRPVERPEGFSDALDDLFALHAQVGPLRGFASDVAAHPSEVARPQALYALGRLYQTRMGQNLVADALYRAAFAREFESPWTRDAVAEFLANHFWNDLAAAELETLLSLESNTATSLSSNANLRLGMVLARLGDDLGAATHEERAMQAIANAGGQVTRVRGGRTYTGKQAQDEIWAEVHWRYLRAAKAKKDRAEIEKRLNALMELMSDDEQIALDVIPALNELGRTEDANRFFIKPYAALRVALDENPKDTERMNALAWLCAKSGQRLEEALGIVQEALRVQSDNYAYMDTAAELNFALGRVEEAVRLEKRALSIKPGDEFMEGQLRRFESKGR
jgi:tetratricopeptide (TPR) repeat protein